MEASDERELIQQVQRGNRAAFRPLVERYQRPILSFIRGYVGDGHDCEDLAQEVFLAAYANIAHYEPGRSAFATWLFTIARNRSLNWRQRHRPSSNQVNLDAPTWRTPLTDATEAEFFEELDIALSRLPEVQRAAFVLYEIEGFSYEQISTIENAPLGTVRSRISRARSALRTALEQRMVEK